MSGIYRAPEVILDMGWDNKVDIWSIGVMVSRDSFHFAIYIHSDGFRRGRWLWAAIFFLSPKKKKKKGGILDDEQHLAEMVSLYWDRKGPSFPSPSTGKGTGKAPCLYQTNHWKCEHSSIMVKIKRPFWVSYEFCASDAGRTCIAFFLINCRRLFGK